MATANNMYDITPAANNIKLLVSANKNNYNINNLSVKH